MDHNCTQCPRKCGANRMDGSFGVCNVPWDFTVARAALHFWEEPSISGKHGSGTIFFSGCPLHCVFCQNREISRGQIGKRIDGDGLSRLMLRLRDAGAHNINLVTPTHYARQLVPVLRAVKPNLGIPIVYNCGGYEDVETLRALEGLVDVYLPDCKYYDVGLSARYSGAADYFPVALAALREMLRQTGTPRLCDGMLYRGVMVRHLVLPAHRADSRMLLQTLAQEIGVRNVLLSLMSQYTPAFAADCPYPELHRRVTTFEYRSVLDEAERLGFDGYFQERSSADALYTPDFHEETF